MDDRDKKLLITLLVSTVVALVFLYFVRRVVTPFFLAFAVAYLLDPLVDRLETWKLQRTPAVVLLLISFFVVVLVAGVVLIPILQVQIQNLAENLPDYLTAIKGWIQPYLQDLAGIDRERIGEVLHDSMQKLGRVPLELLGTAGGWVWGSITGFVNTLLFVVNLVIIPVAMFYLLRDFDEIVARLAKLIPPRYSETTRDVVKEIDDVLSQFVRGQLMVATLMAAMYSVGLYFCGTPLSLLIGMMAGYANLVPYLGVVVGFLPAVLLTFLQTQDWVSLVGVVAVFGVVQAIEGFLITPYVVGDKVGLHPVVIMLAVLIGAELFGLLGILMAVPVAAILNVLGRRGVALYRESSAFS
ncbi:AI-2E family transporter [Nitrospina watsonii]|uniref:Permease often clustered with de novo purine synthesis n=1 Tax=Nitrospina watsonii TaxID=1323948 RepID=A0ABM9HAS7_9BACT|nr:AI-2E family transporter [Nitrospina watsonii]CAI2717242.1 Putative permease often clustered with de novo purine synthesis [Nitrospina watsonii]